MSELQQHFKLRFRQLKSHNPRVSLRSVARKSGISAATLSQFLTEKTNLNLDNALKIIQWLGLSDRDSQAVFAQVVRENIKDPEAIEVYDRIRDRTLDTIKISLEPTERILLEATDK